MITFAVINQEIVRFRIWYKRNYVLVMFLVLNVLYQCGLLVPWQGGDVFVTADSLFTNNKGMQNIGLMPAVQQASAVFSGRRNPNERRNNRKH